MRNFANKPAVAKAAPPPAAQRKGKPTTVVTAAPVAQEFAVGDFVTCLDQSKQALFGGHPGVVMGSSQAKTFDVRVLHRTITCAAPLLQRVEVKESSFALGDLPAPAVALVLFWLPLKDAAVHATVSRKFAAAFRDNVSWKRRCLEAVKGIDVEAVYAEEKESSWVAFYRRHAVYTIHIVTVFHSRGGCSLSGKFAMQCDPRMTVEDFLTRVSSHPQNKQSWGGLPPVLTAHEPNKIGRHDAQFRVVPVNPDAKRNCEFRQDNREATIAEAGLVDGAVLEQPETMMSD